jgi:molybdate transport system ATP-binding protein
MDILDIDISLPRRTFELRAALTVADERVALIGRSGAGKSSLLRAVAGLERPRAGRIALGRDEWFNPERRLHLSPERRRVGYLPQDYGLFPHLSVAANVRFAARRDRPDLLERVGVGHLADARPAQLSGGERQRVALARALAREPRVLLLDEPFAALDAITRRQVRDELAEHLVRLQLPTVAVTHTFEDAVALAGRIGVLEEGRLVQLSEVSDLLRRPATALVAALTGANVLAGTATPRGSGSVVSLPGGGELISAIRASGPVTVAVHPWELEPAEPGQCTVSDVVSDVREDGGRLLVHLSRFTVHAPRTSNGSVELTPGRAVGLRVSPEDVRLIAGNQAGAGFGVARQG